MRRNTALFGASLVAGVAAASGLIMTGGTSSAAPRNSFYGVAWSDPTSGQSQGWKTGTYSDPYGVEFAGAASASAAAAGPATFRSAAGGAAVTVTTTCVAGKPSVLVSGGGAAGVHTGGSVSLATFTNSNAVGTVSFASKTVGGHLVGAYISMPSLSPGTYVALTGADCAAATTPPPATSTTTTPPTSTTTNPPSSTTTNPPTSTPPTTAPPTTEPPTPTPTTTTLPVTG